MLSIGLRLRRVGRVRDEIVIKRPMMLNDFICYGWLGLKAWRMQLDQKLLLLHT